MLSLHWKKLIYWNRSAINKKVRYDYSPQIQYVNDFNLCQVASCTVHIIYYACVNHMYVCEYMLIRFTVSSSSVLDGLWEKTSLTGCPSLISLGWSLVHLHLACLDDWTSTRHCLSSMESLWGSGKRWAMGGWGEEEEEGCTLSPHAASPTWLLFLTERRER